MYKNLKKLKNIKGTTADVRDRIEKAWAWGLITDEQFRELMEMETEESV